MTMHFTLRSLLVSFLLLFIHISRATANEKNSVLRKKGHEFLLEQMKMEISSPLPNLSGQDRYVEISSGQYLRGRVGRKNGQRWFTGIPFAKSPVGDLRWSAPEPPDSWKGVRDAAKFGDSCMQSNSAELLGSGMSEDCLFLNVYAPSSNTSTGSEGKLPVMLFFYGGSWSSGTASCPIYYGEKLVYNSDDAVILVTANYRLNGFGFLGADAMRDSDGSTGNWGLLDQRQAMRWVRSHIAAFGGDPERVTIFGESAGAGSVACHLASKRSFAAVDGPLFSAALMESGSPATPWNSQSMAYAEARARHYVDVLNCTARDGGNITAAEVACLRTKSADEVLAARTGMPSALLTWSPVVDGVELTEEPQETLRKLMAASGSRNDDEMTMATNVTVLLGSNGDEGSEFTELPYDATAEDYESYFISLFGETYAARVLEVYPAAEYNIEGVDGKPGGHGPFYASSRALGDAVFSCPARETARGWASWSNSYVYFFNHTLRVLKVAQNVDPLLQPPPYDSMGVFHSTELGFVFDVEIVLDPKHANDDDDYPAPPDDGNTTYCNERDLADVVGAWWGSFARWHDPNPPSSMMKLNPSCIVPSWPPFNSSNGQTEHFSPQSLDNYLYIGVSSAEQRKGIKDDKCDFWKEMAPIPVSAVFGDLF